MRELTDTEIDEVLKRNGLGTLALLDGEVPYPIPMSFGYAGDGPLFAMHFGESAPSRKVTCWEESPHAGFLVYEKVTEGRTEIWRSVVMSGILTEIEKEHEQEAYMALAMNAEFAPDLSVWGVPLEETEFTLVSLDIEEYSGREFSTGETE